MFFFFRQKTAYEMRISDWSSDVCSSDLKPSKIAEVVCDLSPAFLAAVGETFPDASVTVDWFHVVQLFTRALDEVRKSEARLVKMPTAVRWAVLKAKEKNLTAKQEAALAELEASGLLTGVRSEEHTSELQSLMRISYAVFCLKKKIKHKQD